MDGFRIFWLAAPAALSLVAAPAAAALRGGPCDHPDPRSLEAVYACLSAAHTPGIPSIPTSFHCKGFGIFYTRALVRVGGMSRNRAQMYLPPCAIVAQVIERLRGKPPAWAKCLGAGSGFDAGHFKTCLTAYPREPRDCRSLLAAYELGLKAASPRLRLPAGYRQPGCETVAALMAPPPPPAVEAAASPAGGEPSPAPLPPWAQCLGYDPASVEEHLGRCLGEELMGYRTCRQVRDSYEKRLIGAHGALPITYQILSCVQATPILAEAEQQRAEARRLATARAAERAAARAPRREVPRRREAPPEAGLPWGWLLGGLIAFLIIVRLLRKRPIQAGASWVQVLTSIGKDKVERHTRPRKDEDTSHDW